MNLLTWQIHWADKRSSSTREFSCVANMNAAETEEKHWNNEHMPALKGTAIASHDFSSQPSVALDLQLAQLTST